MYPRNILIVACALVFCVPVMAVINVTPISVGSTYIVWEWTPGLDLSDMYVDGNVMCGYETTDNQYAITDLNPNELHNLTVITSTDSGANLTRTLGGNTTSAGGGESGDALAPGVALGIIGGLIMMVGRKGL